MSFVIRGLHPVEANEPCYLFDVELKDPDALDWGSVTQEVMGEPRSNWQVAWDEQRIDEDRWVFFFHHLDLEKSLLTQFGPVNLPAPTALPSGLSNIKYEPPC